MPKKRYNAEEIIHKLREADVLLSQEINVSQVCKRLDIAEQTYYRWRKANVTGLEWSQVDLERRVAWVHPDQAKARKAIGIPLNDEAVVVLRRQAGKHPCFVFTHRGKPVRNVNTKAWKAALRDCGLPLARPAPYLGVMARTGGHTAQCAAGARRVGVGGYGAALCAPGSGSSREICGAFVAAPCRRRHKSGTRRRW